MVKNSLLHSSLNLRLVINCKFSYCYLQFTLVQYIIIILDKNRSLLSNKNNSKKVALHETSLFSTVNTTLVTDYTFVFIILYDTSSTKTLAKTGGSVGNVPAIGHILHKVVTLTFRTLVHKSEYILFKSGPKIWIIVFNMKVDNNLYIIRSF